MRLLLHNCYYTQMVRCVVCVRACVRGVIRHVTAKELQIVMQSLGQNVTDEDVQAMIEEVDADGNSTIEFEEFCILMCKNMQQKDDQETLREAFKHLDIDDSGSISRDELKEIMQGFSRAGEAIDDDDIDALIAEADLDGDGSIGFDEFVKVMMKDGGT